MTNVSASTSSSSFSSRVKLFPNAQIIAWSFAFSAQAVAVVVGNMLAIALFAFNKKLRKKKSLYLVMNMAFADLMLGGIFLPSFIFFLVNPENQTSYERSIFPKIILTFFSLASSITAALISAERFYAIYWPLKHRTLSSIQACYFDGVDVGYPVFHGLCPTFLEPNDVIQFPVFIHLASRIDYLRPQHRYLEKV